MHSPLQILIFQVSMLYRFYYHIVINSTFHKQHSQPPSSTVEMNGFARRPQVRLSLLIWQPRERKQRVLPPSHSMVFLYLPIPLYIPLLS